MAVQQRVALVTGGVSGIGGATSRMLKEAGFKVAASFLGNGDDAKSFNKETGIPIYEWDIADFEACARGVAQIADDVGPVDVLVNNAGITRDGTLHKMAKERWQAVIDVDLTGCYNMCHAVMSGMRDRGYGRIVSLSSVNALSGQFGQTNYSAAKAGLIGFTKALALESASRGITVNAIAPGYTETPMVRAMPAEVLQKIVDSVPVGRLGRPEEIARGVLFLVGEDSGFITGTTLSINGGKHLP
jgi:acetoacetyl-CoA reductase